MPLEFFELHCHRMNVKLMLVFESLAIHRLVLKLFPKLLGNGQMLGHILLTSGSLLVIESLNACEPLVKSLECRVTLVALHIQQLSKSTHSLGDLMHLTTCHVTLRFDALDELVSDSVEETCGDPLEEFQLRLCFFNLPVKCSDLSCHGCHLVPNQLPLHLGQVLASVLDVVNRCICQRCTDRSLPRKDGILKLCIRGQRSAMHVVEVERLILQVQLVL
mmetsp:Transcript_134295/g.232247  ORF Transcript_134295/g.232247 Transcript_134295/m.232247 type:complete len:219 (+) Transcript_134295:844-1500(+)